MVFPHRPGKMDSVISFWKGYGEPVSEAEVTGRGGQSPERETPFTCTGIRSPRNPVSANEYRSASLISTESLVSSSIREYSVLGIECLGCPGYQEQCNAESNDCRSASISVGGLHCFITVSGSFNRCPVTTHTTRSARIDHSCFGKLAHPCNGSSRCRLNPDPLLLCESPLHRKDLVIGNPFGGSAGLPDCGECLLGVYRCPDTNRGGHGLGLFLGYHFREPLAYRPDNRA